MTYKRIVFAAACLTSVVVVVGALAIALMWSPGYLRLGGLLAGLLVLQVGGA